MSHILEKGTIITCPRKGHQIAVVNQDVITGQVFNISKLFDYETGQERLAGETPKCKICSSQYVVQGKVHTSSGWKPNDPILETPP